MQPNPSNQRYTWTNRHERCQERYMTNQESKWEGQRLPSNWSKQLEQSEICDFNSREFNESIQYRNKVAIVSILRLWYPWASFLHGYGSSNFWRGRVEIGYVFIHPMRAVFSAVSVFTLPLYVVCSRLQVLGLTAQGHRQREHIPSRMTQRCIECLSREFWSYDNLPVLIRCDRWSIQRCARCIRTSRADNEIRSAPR